MTCFHLKAVMTSPPGHSKVEQRTAVVVWSRVTKGKVLETSQLSLQIPPSLPYQPAAASSPLRLVSPYLRSPSQQGHGSQQPLHHFITPRPIATFKPQVPREVKKKKREELQFQDVSFIRKKHRKYVWKQNQRELEQGHTECYKPKSFVRMQ